MPRPVSLTLNNNRSASMWLTRSVMLAADGGKFAGIAQ